MTQNSQAKVQQDEEYIADTITVMLQPIQIYALFLPALFMPLFIFPWILAIVGMIIAYVLRRHNLPVGQLVRYINTLFQPKVLMPNRIQANRHRGRHSNDGMD